MRFAVYAQDGRVLRHGEAATKAQALEHEGPGERVAIIPKDANVDGALIVNDKIILGPGPTRSIESSPLTPTGENILLRNRLVNTSLWAVSRGSPLTEASQNEWEHYIADLHRVDPADPVWPQEPTKEFRS